MITLDQLKEHLNIEDDMDDAYLSSIIEVATDAVLKNLNIKDFEGDYPPSVVHSVLVLAGTLYSNRESVTYASAVKVPHTFDYLISLNKNYGEGIV